MTVVSIFLGTSASLMKLRTFIGNAVRELSMQTERQGVRLELLCWEDYRAEYIGDSKQLEYDRDLVLKSDIVITAFKEKIGEWTAHELEVAQKGGKADVFCYCLKCKQQKDIESELQTKGFETISVITEQDVLDSIKVKINDYLASIPTTSNDALFSYGIEKYFYATIPADMQGYRTLFGNMIRSLDVVTTKELDIHCMLYPYNTPTWIATTNHYIGLFKNTANEDEINEMQEALRCLDAKENMEAFSVFQQKANPLEQSKGIRHDIRKNCPSIKQIVDDRCIFTIGIHNLVKVKLHLLLWCLRMRSIAILPSSTEFSCEDGKIKFLGNYIVDIADLEEFENIKTLFKQERSLTDELKQLKKASPLDSSAIYNKRLELRNISAQLHCQFVMQLDDMMNWEETEGIFYDSEKPLDCNTILETQQAELAELSSISSDTKHKWEEDKRRLHSRRDYLQQHIEDDPSCRKELKTVQDTLLQVVRNMETIGGVSKMELLAELMHTVGVYDTFILGHVKCDRDPLYAEIVTIADQIDYSDVSVEMMRLNLGNHYSRLLQHSDAIACYEKTLVNIQKMDDSSHYMRLYICHFYEAAIYSYILLDFSHPRIAELLDSFAKLLERWGKGKDDNLIIYQALFQTTRLRGIYGLKGDGFQMVEDARKVYDEVSERRMLKVGHQWFGEVMCYLPNVIASFYLEHYPIHDGTKAKRYFDIVVRYIDEQIKNAELLLDAEPIEATVYLGHAHHNKGYLYSFQSDIQYLTKGVKEYREALKHRHWVFQQTGSLSDEIVIAETNVNLGAILLTVYMNYGYVTDQKDLSPVACAKVALDIYGKYKSYNSVDEQLRYYQALQLYASSIYFMEGYEKYREEMPKVLDMLKECLEWSRTHPGNSYESLFEIISGGILKEASNY